MKTTVSIYGGFAGTETQLNLRDWENNTTICSGDIGVEDDSTDNCFHVFYHTADMAIDNRSLLDGFTITGGNADSTDPHNCGGGMYNKLARPSLYNCKITGNYAEYGGGVYNTNGSAIKMVNCTIINNQVKSYGGGIANYMASAAIIEECAISSNNAQSGGAICNDNSSPIILKSTVSENSSTGQGGGIYNRNSSPIIDSSKISSNSGGSYGGGIYCYSSSFPTIMNSFFSGNSGTNGGGIYYAYGCHSVIHNCTFFNNIASLSNGGGGGIYNQYNSKILITNSTFLSNSSSGFGGGCAFHAGGSSADSIWIVNSTFSGNIANTEGGGIYFRYGGDNKEDRIINCIFWGNSSGSGSNELYTAMNVPVIIKNTVIEGGFIDTMAIMSDIFTDNPNLDGLLDNSGPVKTMALLDGSSALDNGVYVYIDNKSLFYNTDGGSSYLDFSDSTYTPVGSVTRLNATDARGVTRPQGSGIDLGAFER